MERSDLSDGGLLSGFDPNRVAPVALKEQFRALERIYDERCQSGS